MNRGKIILFSALFLLLTVSVVSLSLSDDSEGGSKPVACIGGTEYVDLQDAIDAASDGDVVTLVSDVILTEGGGNYAFLISGKSITIDLNGYRIEQNSSSSSYVSIIATEVADTPTHLVLKDGSKNGTGCIYTCGTTFSLSSAILIWNDITNSASDDTECSIIFESGTYHAKAVSNGDGMVYTSSHTVIEDGDIKKGVWVKGGRFILDNVGTLSNGSPWMFNAKGQNAGKTVMITGGTFNSDIQNQYYVFEVDIPKQYALKDNGDGTCTIVDAVCYVDVRHHSGAWYVYHYGCESFEEALTLIDLEKVEVENGKGTTITMIDYCCIDELDLDSIDIEFYLTSEKGLYALGDTTIPGNVHCILAPDVAGGCAYHKSSSRFPCSPGECTECHEPIVPAVEHEYMDGEEAITCVDRDCVVCGVEGVFTSTTGHEPSSGEMDMVCIDRTCAICKEFIIPKAENHRFDASVEDMPCILRTCTLCNGDIAPTVEHIDSDPSKTCVDRDCVVCGTEGVFESTTGHAPSNDEVDMVCKDRICHICENFSIVATEGHTFSEGMEHVTCVDRVCVVCDATIEAMFQHTYVDGEESITCVDRDCAVCGEMELPATTGHEPSDEEVDMVCKDRVCHICEEFVIESAVWHVFDDTDATCVDRTCSRCSEVVEHTTDHDYVLDDNDDSICTLCGEMLESEGEDHVSSSYIAIAMVTLLAGHLLLIGRGGS